MATKKKQTLRNSEYYDMQSTFDELYAKSQNGQVFQNLMGIICSEENIQLAYRNACGKIYPHCAEEAGMV